jgi:hypothetical protein
MSGVRQAALVLHGLADADRAWMLGQLPPEQAGPVRELLTELRELGIPNDPGLATQALASDPVHAIRTRPAPAANDPVALMRAASVEQVQHAVEGESQGFVAVLLVAADWPWYRAFLAAQEPARMRALVDLVRDQPGGARLRTQVVAAVAARLRERPAAAAPLRVQAQPARGKSLRQLGAMVIPMFKRGRR